MPKMLVKAWRNRLKEKAKEMQKCVESEERRRGREGRKEKRRFGVIDCEGRRHPFRRKNRMQLKTLALSGGFTVS